MKRATPLNVGGAFHTPLMRDAAARPASSRLADVRLRRPAAPVVSNHDARAYADADGWRDRASPDHVAVPVRWRSSMETIAGLGADDVPRGRARLDARRRSPSAPFPTSPSVDIAIPTTSPTIARGGPLTHGSPARPRRRARSCPSG